LNKDTILFNYAVFFFEYLLWIQINYLIDVKEKQFSSSF